MNVESQVRRWMWSLHCRHELKSWSKFWLKQVISCLMSCRRWSVLPTKRQELGIEEISIDLFWNFTLPVLWSQKEWNRGYVTWACPSYWETDCIMPDGVCWREGGEEKEMGRRIRSLVQIYFCCFQSLWNSRF